jgi:hypothetical protein
MLLLKKILLFSVKKRGNEEKKSRIEKIETESSWRKRQNKRCKENNTIKYFIVIFLYIFPPDTIG